MIIRFSINEVFMNNFNEITIAHSPDSDDAFMFYALAHDKLKLKNLKIKQVLKDIQSLNEEARIGKYEITAISFAAYPYVMDKYYLMPCGASVGDKYGPILVAKDGVKLNNIENLKIGIPGKLTTAFLALSIYHPNLQVVEMPFDKIMAAVVNDEIDAGLLIHEGQLTYQDFNLVNLLDLGMWWYEETKLPLVLGGNVIRKDLDPELIQELTLLLRNAIVYSLSNRQEALDYALTFARDMNPGLADKFVGMYVNDYTVDYGDTGRLAIQTLFEYANHKGLFKQKILPEFV